MRRSATSLLALGGILLLGFAGLASSPTAACPERLCPMMRASGMAEGMPCHGGAQLGAAMDCCVPPAAVPAAAPTLGCPHASASADGELPTGAALGPHLAQRALAQPRPHDALLHELGLYTLHSVYRI